MIFSIIYQWSNGTGISYAAAEWARKQVGDSYPESEKNKSDVLASREINPKEILRDTKVCSQEYSWQYYLW